MAAFILRDEDLLRKIDALFLERAKVISKYSEFINSFEFYQCLMNVRDSLTFGLSFISLGVKTSASDGVDKSKWRISKSTDPEYVHLYPRKTNKEFFQAYEDHFPKDVFSYEPLLKLILDEEYSPYLKGEIVFNYIAAEYFLIEDNNWYKLIDKFELISDEEAKQLVGSD